MKPPRDRKIRGATPSPGSMKTKLVVILSLTAAVAAVGAVLVRHGMAHHSGHHDHSSHDHGASAATREAWRLEFHNPAPAAGAETELNLHLWNSSDRLITFA